MIVAGFAVHESDAAHLQSKLESFLHGKLTPLGLNAHDFEIHATDMKNGSRDWAVLKGDFRFRMATLQGAVSTLIRFSETNTNFPVSLFGAVVDRDKVRDRKDREKLAYELVLNKFDAMLGRLNRTHSAQRGLVIHDQRVVHGGRRVVTVERNIQSWTADWREAAGKIGQLKNFADVPLFADSQATRLLQAADIVSFALWRHYGCSDNSLLDRMTPRFDHADGVMHGLIHVSRHYATRSCPCPPCRNRIERGIDPEK